MKAIVIHKHGDPSVLRYTDVPEPVFRHNEVAGSRARLRSLNASRPAGFAAAFPALRIPLPHIPGSDVAGEVAKVGPEVSTVHVGQKVVLAPGVTCGKCPACIAGLDNRCRNFTNLGYMIDGGCDGVCARAGGELPALSRKSGLAASRCRASRFPDRLAHAGQPRSTATRRNGAGSRCWKRGGQRRHPSRQVFRRARVIATAGTDEKLAKARELGADEVIHHFIMPISKEVRRLTNNRGVDVVVEHVGAATWGAQPEEPCTQRPTGYLRRHHWLRRQTRYPLSVFAPAFHPWLLHGHQGRTPYRPESSSPKDASALPSTKSGLSTNAPRPTTIWKSAKQFGKVVLTIP